MPYVTTTGDKLSETLPPGNGAMAVAVVRRRRRGDGEVDAGLVRLALAKPVPLDDLFFFRLWY